jgi:hypothetical protein
MTERQAILRGMIEGALRAAADPSVTTVLQDWDYYPPGDTAQPLAPFLVVGLTDDIPYGVGIGLYRCSAQVMIAVADSPSIRDDFDRIRASVRSVMDSLAHSSAWGVIIGGTLEQGCTQPDVITEDGDIILAQTVMYRVWFESPLPPPAVLHPDIYLVAHDPDTGITYTTTQATDPRRIDRWSPTPSGVMLSHGFGAWDDRADLTYSAPVQPLSTSLPPPVSAADQ